MPFYIRKSISAGPFRFNLSKSGIGLSVGVKGLRVGVGPRGHYIHAGRGGLYYRASLSSPKEDGPRTVPSAPSWQESSGVEMIEIESGDVLEMQDEKFVDLLKEMNAKQALTSRAKAFGWMTFGAGIIALFINSQVGFGILVGTLPAWLIGKWLDSYQKRSVLFYNLEPEVMAAYEHMTQAFDTLAACAGKWHVEAGGAVQDLTTWKRNAGASHIVQRKPTSLRYGLPPVLVSNISPPIAQVGKQTIHFLPDVVLIVDKNKIGAVSYGNLRLRWQDSNFIEEGTVPSDAEIISHTWKHPNKSGGPDRRFANNYQIPVCRYEVLHLSSDSGVNEMLEFSRTGLCRGFSDALEQLHWSVHLPAKQALPS